MISLLAPGNSLLTSSAIFFEQGFISFQPRLGEVADQELDGGRFLVAADVVRMDVPFPLLGGFRRQGLLGQSFDDVGGDFDGVDHFVLGHARVNVDPANFDFQRVGAECFILHFPHFLAVDRIAEIGPDLGDGDVLHAAARLFIGSEYHVDVRPRQSSDGRADGSVRP